MSTANTNNSLVQSKPADAAVRERALDTSESFIVQAPAGSGKTELLTRRVLGLLALVDEPEEVLAITFTKKAASEMRNRVVDVLRHTKSGAEPKDDYEASGMAMAQAVLQRDQERDWNLLENSQRLNLRTIDALCTTLAHRLPLVSALGGATRTSDDAKPLYMEAAERLLDERAGDLDLLLLQRGNQTSQVQQMLASLLATRDQWRDYTMNNPSDEELRDKLESMLEDLVESRLQALNTEFPIDLVDPLLHVLRQKGSVHAELLRDGGDDASEAEAYANLGTTLGDSAADLPDWVLVANAVLTAQAAKDAGLRKPGGLNRKVGFPTTEKDAQIAGVTRPELANMKQAMGDALETLGEYPQVVALLNEVRRLPAGGYKDEDWALLSQLLSMLPALLVELQIVFAEHGEIDFVETALRAQRALGTEDAPTDLALSLDLTIKHILVDEFQDTSRTQFEFYKLLVAGWESNDGRTFFAVGDPMQSIYRFREGDVTLFALAQEHGIGQLELEPLQLTVNFRAASPVVDWVNETFSDVFPTRSDAMTGAVPYAQSVAHLAGSGSVELHSFVDADATEEASRVALIAEQAIAQSDVTEDAKPHSVAILLRARGQAAPIFAALQSRGISYQSIELELLGDRLVVRDIVSLCLALRYPHDRLHWIAVLRAPWCALELTDLHTLMSEARQQTVFDLLHDKERLDNLSGDGRLRIEKLLQVLEPAVSRASRGTMMPWVESCWIQLGGPLVCKDKTDLDAAERCIAQLQKLEQSGKLWQPSVIRNSMETLYAAPADPEAQVQVMTLHKSKGLEFDTVILPSLHRKPRPNVPGALNWFEWGSDADARLLLAPISERGIDSKNRDPINSLVQRANQQCDEQEKLRLLYVACTRAKTNLHLSGILKTNSHDELGQADPRSLMQPLWPMFAAHANQQSFSQTDAVASDTDSRSLESTDESNTDDMTPIAPFLRISPGWCLPELPTFLWPEESIRQSSTEDTVEYTWASTLARDVGTVVHDQLQLLSEQSQVDAANNKASMDKLAQRARRQLINLGVSTAQLNSAVEKVVDALTKTLSDERGQWILDSGHEDARSEWALSAPIENVVTRMVIDRTFVDKDGTRWIIDFKTGDHRGGDLEKFLDDELVRYASQLQGYVDVIGRVENRNIRAALYFPLLGGWRELEQGEAGFRSDAPQNPQQKELF